jgi:hypothetical protein
MSNKHKKDFEVSQTVYDGEVEVADCTLEENLDNPACDLGHSYSYSSKYLKEDKESDNFGLIAPRFNKIVATYSHLINEDKILSDIIGELQNLFNEIQLGRFEELAKCHKDGYNLLKKAITLVTLDTVELDRMAGESPQGSIDTNKQQQLMQLKKELEEVKLTYLVVY